MRGAAAGPASVKVDHLVIPAIRRGGAIIGDDPNLLARVIGPQHALLPADGTITVSHGVGGGGNLEPHRTAMATCLNHALTGGRFVLAAGDESLRGAESDLCVGAIAKRLRSRAAATAERKGFAFDFVSDAIPVHDLHVIAVDEIGSVLAYLDGDHDSSVWPAATGRTQHKHRCCRRPLLGVPLCIPHCKSMRSVRLCRRYAPHQR